MKGFFQNKTVGFYLTLVCIALTLVTAAVYAGIYSKTRLMSWTAVGILAAGAVLTAVLIAAKQYRFAPSMLMAADFLAFLFYVYSIYFFVSSVATGIQFSGFPPEFFLNIIFFVATIAVSVICVFLPQTRE